MLVTVVVFLTGTVGFLLSTGGDVVFVFSSMFSILLRNSLDEAVVLAKVEVEAVKWLVLLLLNDEGIVLFSCCCMCSCCFLRAKRLATSVPFVVKSKFFVSKDLR